MTTTKVINAHPHRHNRVWTKIWQHRHLYLMLVIPIAFYILFCYWPMYGVQIAFKKYNVRMGIEGSPWVGLKYFEKYLNDPYFWKVVRNTLLLNIYSLVFSFPAPIILALLLNELKSSVYKKLVQSISYLPHFISTVVVCGMVVNFLANSGPINDVIVALGGQRIQFLMEAKYFRTIYIVSGIWQNIGWNSIIYFAAISAVDPSLYEAALMDGVNLWQLMTKILVPIAKPVLATVIVFNLLYIWNEYPFASIMIENPAYYTISRGIAAFQGQYNIDYGGLAAYSVMVLLPELVFYGIFQRHVVDGMTVGAVKG